jgi:hypothetical protein
MLQVLLIAICLTDSTEPITFKRNGGWCWFQDERVIVVDDQLFIGSVASAQRDGSSLGDVQITRYDPETGEHHTFKLSADYQRDDHNVPALLAVWGPCAPQCPADLNGDGTVDVTDRLQLLSAWNSCW